MAVTRKWIHKIFTAGLLFQIFVFSSLSVQAQVDPPPPITEIAESELNQATQPLPAVGVAALQNVYVQSENIDRIAASFENNQHGAYRASFDVLDGVSFIAVFTHKASTLKGGYLLSGSLEDTPGGYINLVSSDGIISAILTDGNQQYQLTQNSNQQYQFIRIDQSSFPTELEPLEPPMTQTAIEEDQSPPAIALDTGSMIDVMVVYTDDARLGAGGKTNMENLINLAVAETNQGYLRSNINHRFNLVHTTEISFNEFNGGTSLDWITTINNLTNSDGIIDDVLTLRNTYAADLVVMIVEDYHDTCGIGWLMTSSTMTASHGFSVVSRRCATGYYSFAHETGHNMGAHHNREDTTSIGYFSYSYGYWAPNASFRTIMAYDCRPVSCPRVNNWSNPQILYNGIPTGVDSNAFNSADNRMTLNYTAPIVANFRQSVVAPSAPTNLFVSDQTMHSISIRFTDNSNNETGFKVERSLNGQPWSQVITLPANTTNYTDSELSCSQNYAYRVRAYNTFADSVYSNIVSTTTLVCGPPLAPDPIHLSISTNSVLFAWQDVEGETSYLVEQLSGNPLVWSPLETLPANSTSYYLQNLEKNSAYTVRFTAKNSYGDTIGNPIPFITMSHAIFLPVVTR